MALLVVRVLGLVLRLVLGLVFRLVLGLSLVLRLVLRLGLVLRLVFRLVVGVLLHKHKRQQRVKRSRRGKNTHVAALEVVFPGLAVAEAATAVLLGRVRVVLESVVVGLVVLVRLVGLGLVVCRLHGVNQQQHTNNWQGRQQTLLS